MSFPEPDEYWRLWPLPTSSLERWPWGEESASDRNGLIDYLEGLCDPSALANIDLDPYMAGFWMLAEAERRSWMGAFFHHMRRCSLESLFSTQVFGAFEVPPSFDPRHASFFQDKQAYDVSERELILRLMATGYETVFEEDDWRYRAETLAYWSNL